MEFRYAKLRGRIVEKYGSQKDFAKALGTSQVTMSKKMQGKSGFSKADIVKWSDLLDISSEDCSEYFFT